MVLPSGETSNEIQVPSSVVNSILRSDFRGRPFFSSFFSPFLSFCCSAASCRVALALSADAPLKVIARTIANPTNHAVPPPIPACLTLLLDFLHTAPLHSARLSSAPTAADTPSPRLP